MVLPLVVVSTLLLQYGGTDPELARRIHHLLTTVLTSDDEKQEAAANADAKDVFLKRGLPAIAVVGDRAAYEFVVLTCSSGSADLRTQVLREARAAVRKRAIPADAATYCEAHLRQEAATARAKQQAPTHPALREQIEQVYRVDQSVRDKNGFDLEKMSRTDRAHSHIVEAMFLKYGVPTYRMVGPDAASAFITVVQHQSSEFRKRVLPGLAANVRAGEADPRSYASMLDRLRTDAGEKEVYGENLICDKEHPQLHPGPIEDERTVDVRRAAIGLLRLELYTELAISMSPDICSAVAQ